MVEKNRDVFSSSLEESQVLIMRWSHMQWFNEDEHKPELSSDSFAPDDHTYNSKTV